MLCIQFINLRELYLLHHYLCSDRRLRCHTDSLGIRFWRGADRRSTARYLHSAAYSRSTRRARVDHHLWHRRRTGLE